MWKHATIDDNNKNKNGTIIINNIQEKSNIKGSHTPTLVNHKGHNIKT